MKENLGTISLCVVKGWPFIKMTFPFVTAGSLFAYLGMFHYDFHGYLGNTSAEMCFDSPAPKSQASRTPPHTAVLTKVSLVPDTIAARSEGFPGVIITGCDWFWQTGRALPSPQPLDPRAPTSTGTSRPSREVQEIRGDVLLVR